MPWRGVWGRNGARRGRRARVPPPARAASRREQAQPALQRELSAVQGSLSLLAATAAPPAPLGGDGDQPRRGADSEKLQRSPAAGGALRAAGFGYMRKKSERQEEKVRLEEGQRKEGWKETPAATNTINCILNHLSLAPFLQHAPVNFLCAEF
ncbi:uncharacterized protein LOC119088076 [Peromyscus leucopus]|uniref:uncharacterized protein LOC119088076 n=1 Tax=Peromyscus leucopus TaxID=10041 RepID=UPI00188505B8|nr:uncharacterized protein LOC119088076 [Peromyscus leucopus]